MEIRGGRENQDRHVRRLSSCRLDDIEDAVDVAGHGAAHGRGCPDRRVSGAGALRFQNQLQGDPVIGITSAYTLEEIATQSKKANDFFEKRWDETLSRHLVDESFYGIKTH